MIGLDTNVLVRHIMQDDPRQSPIATRYVESLTAAAPGFVPLVTIVELVWVLSAAYELGRPQLVAALQGLLRSKELIIAEAETVWKALRVFQSSNADWADCLIERSAAAAGCAETVTFDRSAVGGCSMRLLT